MTTYDLLIRKQSGRASSLTAAVNQLRSGIHGDKPPENNLDYTLPREEAWEETQS